MNVQGLRRAGCVAVLALGTMAAVSLAASVIADQRAAADGTRSIEQILPTATGVTPASPTFESRNLRRPCPDAPPLPSAIAAESGLFLLSNPEPSTTYDGALEILGQLI